MNCEMMSVYLMFCVAKIMWDVFLGIWFVSCCRFWWLRLYFFEALVQLWIIQVVGVFWIALGTTVPTRRPSGTVRKHLFAGLLGDAF